MNNNLQENTLQENTATQNNREPTLCVGCYEFFGNPAQEDLCSKCFKGRQKTKATPPVSEAPKQLPVEKTSQETSSLENKTEPKTTEETKENQEPQQIDKSKCWGCKRKVGMLGYACRCSFTFCKLHRLPEDHECAFDYTTKEREKLKEKNPVVAASKLEKI